MSGGGVAEAAAPAWDAHTAALKARLLFVAYSGIYWCYTVLTFSSTPLNGAQVFGGAHTAA